MKDSPGNRTTFAPALAAAGPSPVAVFSTNRELAECLSTLLDAIREIMPFEHPTDLVRFVRSERPTAIVVDFSSITSGGHEECRLLDSLVQLVPEAAIVLIIPEQCPEPLKRRAVCGGFPTFAETDPPADVAEALRSSSADASECDTESAFSESASVDRNSETHVATDGHAKSGNAHANDGNGHIHGNNGHGRANNGRTHAEAAAENEISRAFRTTSPQMQQMLADLQVAARHDVTILLVGETGSGKTYLSRLIHEASPRRNEPFLHVACGVLPAELIESELFGHVKGAFTGAHTDKEGKFVVAGCGTVLLDEIDVLGPEQQVKLLRVIETGEFEPVGSNRTHTSRARLVVASNLDLEPLVEDHRFRPDLYYRLNMLKFDVLPLRHRGCDIVPLAELFIEQFSRKHNVTIREVEPGVFEALLAYSWPGNVRELENVIQRAVIYARGEQISLRQLPLHILNAKSGTDPACEPTPSSAGQSARRNMLVRQIALTERDIIEQALYRNNYSRTKTARELGISRVTLYNKMKKYGMSR